MIDADELRARLDAAIAEGVAANARRFLGLTGARDGDVVELTALHVPDPRGRGPSRIMVARATSARAVVQLLEDAEATDGLRNAVGLYAIPNVLDPVFKALPGGVNRWVVAEKDSRAKDEHIPARNVIFADIDPVKAHKLVQASAEERAGAWARGLDAARSLASIVGEDVLAIGDSGNGVSLFVALDRIPETAELHAATVSILASLHALHGADVTVSNAARLVPAFGSWKRKGADTPERAHRRTGLVVLGEKKLATLEEVQDLAAKLRELAPTKDEPKPLRPAAVPSRDRTGPRPAPDPSSPFDLANAVPMADVVAHLGLDDGGVLRCPRGCDGGTSVAILKDANVLKCSHNTCADVGPHGGGVRTCVDLWAEVKGGNALEAALAICAWRGIDVAPRNNRTSSHRDDRGQRHGDRERSAPFDDAPMPGGPDSGPRGEERTESRSEGSGDARRDRLHAALRDAEAALRGYQAEAVDEAARGLRDALDSLDRSERGEWKTAEARALALGLVGQRMPTAIETFDLATRGGPLSGRRIVLGGAPGAGKTTLAVQLAWHYHERGHAVAIVAADEEADGLLQRVGQLCGLDRSQLEQGVEGARVHLAERVRSERLLLVDQDEEDGAELEHVIKRLAGIAAATEMPGVLVVDSLQTVHTLVGAELEGEPRARLDAVMKLVKAASKRHGFLIIATSEMARGYYRGGGVPSTDALAAFKESGAIEYLASIALGLRSVKGETDLIDVEIAKNRGGDKTYPGFRLRIDYDRAELSEVERPAESEADGDRDAARDAAAERKDARIEKLAKHLLQVLVRHPHPITGQRELRSLIQGSNDEKQAAIAWLQARHLITGGGKKDPYRAVPQPAETSRERDEDEAA